MKLSKTRIETIGLLFLVFAAAAAIIWIRTATVKDTYLFVQNEKELRKLAQEIQAVRVRWLRMTAPGKLEALAQSLELYPPKIDQVLRYRVPEKTDLEIPAASHWKRKDATAVASSVK